MPAVSKHQRRTNRRASAVGLMATVVVVALYAGGALDWLELKTLDQRFCHANAMPEHPDIVLVDIDDGSLETVGRWPWPRDVQAAIIEILAEAGARAVLYDIQLVEPQPARTITRRQADLIENPLSIASDLSVAFPDHELRSAIERAGAVYLAFDFGQPKTGVDAALAGRIRTWLDADASRWERDGVALYAELSSLWAAGAGGPHPEVLAQTLRHVLGVQATVGPSRITRGAVWTHPVKHMTPVYFPHARAARRCGFVVFEPDLDGIMRRVQLFAEHRDHVLPQLAAAVALDESDWRPKWAGMAGTQPMQRFEHADGRVALVHLDEAGRALVPWVPQRDWTQQFGPHIPADAVWLVHDRRQSIRHNRTIIATAAQMIADTTGAARAGTYADDLRQVRRLEDELRLARYTRDSDKAAQVAEWLRQYAHVLPAAQRELAQTLDDLCAQATTRPAPEIANACATIQHAWQANADLEDEIDAALGRLRSRVDQRICLVGYTATALPDMVPIPTHPRAPGVIAHANILNGLLQGRFVSWWPLWLNAIAALLAGLVATLISVKYHARNAAALVALLAVAYVALAGWWTFYLTLRWVALTPVVGAIAASFFAIVLFRYIFLERESRALAAALGQYTSATLARQMAEDAELCKRAEMREVTAVFTDLAGFTQISERIGAERTQHVLNVALGRFSDVMLHYEGMVNKFIGDGIFAFWNPLIYPQPDHARRACDTAVDLLVALRELVAVQRRQGGDAAFADLQLRVGVATGNAIVGPCGSEKKYDYTCIGDSVNIAARLESANKFFGTRVLVSGPTRDAAGGRFAFRALGGLQVKGKTHAVDVYELLGRQGEVPDDMLRHADAFGAGVTAFRNRDWAAARTCLDACREQCAEDAAVLAYLRLIEHYEAEPPADDWDGRIELTEK